MRWLSPPDRVPEAARQGQVFEPDILQEAQPLVDLLEDALGDLALLGGQVSASRPPNQSTASAIDSSRDLADVCARRS